MEIRAQDLGMKFDDAGRTVTVFERLNLTIRSGTSLAIVGKSGVGKTTLLYILGGLEQPTEGEVFVGGTNLTAQYRSGEDLAPFRGTNIGFVFQSHQLLPEFDALENVALPLFIRGVAEQEARAQAEELLVSVGLKDRVTHRPGALSGGEQQRVAMARALVGSPGVVLADEPTGNLDLQTGGQVMDILLSLHRQRKTTLILVTHSPDLAAKLDAVVELTPGGFIEHT
ncbi:MAG: ABC transporter ATP-binding protein [Deltaproteobacteria bacterium]|nr:ABC transporter ATP-binding protein [Deltaproteobacteria bacterium]